MFSASSSTPSTVAVEVCDLSMLVNVTLAGTSELSAREYKVATLYRKIEHFSIIPELCKLIIRIVDKLS